MKLYPSKCEALRVTNKANLTHMSYYERIKEVSHVKYFGVTIRTSTPDME